MGGCTCGSCLFCNPDQLECPDCHSTVIGATCSGGTAVYTAMACGNVREYNRGESTWLDECDLKQMLIQYGDDPKVGKTEFMSRGAFMEKFGLKLTAGQKVKAKAMKERYGGSEHAPTG